MVYQKKNLNVVTGNKLEQISQDNNLVNAKEIPIVPVEKDMVSENPSKISENVVNVIAPDRISDITDEKRTESLMSNPFDEDKYTLEIIEDWDGKVDIFHLSKKDPDYEYRFLRAEFKNLSLKTGNLLLQKGGWQIVPRQALEKMGLSKYVAADGLYRVGDTVLCRIPKALYEKKLEHSKKKAREPMDRIERMLKKGDDSVAGIGHENMKGLQTDKALGFR